MKQINNPLNGHVRIKNGGLEISTAIKFGGQLEPKVKPREWFYLLIDAIGERKDNKFNNFIESSLGSRATQWRTRKSLISKGYLVK